MKKYKNSISCAAISQGQIEKLKNGFQTYEIRNPGALSFDQVQAWVEKSPVDQVCLRGLSELKMFPGQSGIGGVIKPPKMA